MKPYVYKFKAVKDSKFVEIIHETEEKMSEIELEKFKKDMCIKHDCETILLVDLPKDRTTPSSVYNLQPIKIKRCLGNLKGFYYDHLPEIKDDLWGLQDKNKKVKIKYYADHCFDGRRTWTLASVWYEDKPVMIIQNAGREGDDHYKRFITSKKLFREMVNYITSILPTNDFEVEFFDENEEIEGLIEFYGHHLDNVEKESF